MKARSRFVRLLGCVATVVAIAHAAGTAPAAAQADGDVDGTQIVGGQLASPGEYPYFVSLQRIGGGHVCGGSLVRPNLVLTAAHCVTDANGVVDLPANQMRLVIGRTRLSDSTQGEARNATQLYVHSSWNGEFTRGYDLA